jgi:UDP-4-amino-4,6-dideoxy-N-acetyl-beta-L-altrosamine N-acetyltransferase
MIREVNLREISVYDLELIRFWRNKNHVRKQMNSSDLIKSEGQKKWFSSLNKKNNHLFIYSEGDIDVGVVVCKITDMSNGIFDIGIYCGNEEYFGHPINFLSLIKIHDFAFEKLNLSKCITSIKRDNISVIKMDKRIGYQYEKKLNKDFDEYYLNKKNYLESRKKLNKVINF